MNTDVRYQHCYVDIGHQYSNYMNMNKKTILFIGLMVCFLGVLAYVETLERAKQEQAELEQAELKQTEISEAEKEVSWDRITPQHFLIEDIFGVIPDQSYHRSLLLLSVNATLLVHIFFVLFLNFHYKSNLLT